MTIVCGFALSAKAQIGTNAYSFLEVPTSSRAMAMGGYGIAITEPDVTLAEQNPALIGPELESQFALGYMRYFGSSNFASARFGHAIGERGAYAVGIRYLDYGSIEGYLPDGTWTGSFKPQDIAFEGTYSHDFTDYLRGGINVKMVYSNYESYNAFAMAVDLGVNYFNPERRTSLSAVIKNAGGQLKRFNDKYDHLPFDVQLGWMQGFGEGPFSLSVTAHHLTKWKLPHYEHDASDGEHQQSVKENFGSNLLRHLTFGVQYSPSDRFYIGVGYDYKTRSDLSGYQRNFFSGWSLGTGINVKSFGIGVSYAQPHKGASSVMLNLSCDIWEFM